MATKKTANEEGTISEQADNEIYDPMLDMVNVYLPRATGDEEDTVFVGFNGKGYLIERGTNVQLPRPVAAVLSDSELRKQRQEDYHRELAEQARNHQPRVWR